jgi:hypothetical protein
MLLFQGLCSGTPLFPARAGIREAVILLKLRVDNSILSAPKMPFTMKTTLPSVMKYSAILLLLLLFALGGQARKIKIAVHDIKGYGEYEKFAREAIAKMEAAINSDEFGERLLRMKLKHRKGLSNRQILGKIMAAVEQFGESGEANTMDLRLRVMTLEEDGQNWMDNCAYKSTLGKEANTTGYVVTCTETLRAWHAAGSHACLAGHYMHEFLHNLAVDFRHPYPYKYRSVVYQVGYLVRDMIQGNDNDCPLK